MISDFLERLFLGQETTSRDNVKSRLKIVLAQDRANLSPEMMEAMRREIVEVVSRYVEIDTEGLNFSLESDQRATALIANLPIRRIKFEPDAKPSSLTQSSIPSSSELASESQLELPGIPDVGDSSESSPNIDSSL